MRYDLKHSAEHLRAWGYYDNYADCVLFFFFYQIFEYEDFRNSSESSEQYEEYETYEDRYGPAERERVVTWDGQVRQTRDLQQQLVNTNDCRRKDV